MEQEGAKFDVGGEGAQIKFVTLLFNQLKCVKTHDAGTDRVEFFLLLSGFSQDTL